MRIEPSDVGKTIRYGGVGELMDIKGIHDKSIWVQYRSDGRYETWKRSDPHYEFIEPRQKSTEDDPSYKKLHDDCDKILEPRQKPSQRLKKNAEDFKWTFGDSHYDNQLANFILNILIPSLGKIFDEMKEKK